jgi:hypothetical protein
MYLGPLFGTKRINGPVVVNYCNWKGNDVYLVGEVHELNGDRDGNRKDYVIDQILQGCEKMSIRCYYEGCNS